MPPPESARMRTLRRRWPGSWARASRVISMWSAAVLDPAFPGRSMMASGSPDPSGPWSAKAASGWNPKVFFQVGVAWAFSEYAVTTVASMSTVTSGAVRARGGVRGQRPGPVAGRGPGGADGLQRPRRVRGQLRDQPGDHRVRGHRPGQVRLRTQHRDIGQAVTAQGHGHGQVRDDLPRVVDGPRRLPPLQPGGQLPVQAGHAQDLGEQDRSGLGDDPRSVGGHPHLRAGSGKIHLESASRTGVEWTLDKPYSPSSRHFSHVKQPAGGNPSRKPEARSRGNRTCRIVSTAVVIPRHVSFWRLA